MANTEERTCQVPMHGGKPCRRALYDEKCICHSEKKDKDVVLFRKELDRIFSDDKRTNYDLSGFVFHRTADLPHEYPKNVGFEGAKFLGKTSFANVEFSQRASFDDAVFFGAASFRGTKFKGYVSFCDVTCNGKMRFTAAQFSKDALFLSSTFTEDADFSFCRVMENAQLLFYCHEKGKRLFLKGALFTWVFIDTGGAIRFRKTDLSKCQLLETDVTKMEFIDVDWPQTNRWFGKIGRRKCVVEELILESKRDPKPEYNLIAQLYRRLQKNYIESYQYAEAGDFYDGEQEMVRRAKGPWGQYFCTNYLYRLVSDYGETWWKPLIFLGPTLLIFPFILLLDGINLAKYYGYGDSNPVTNYAWSFNPGDFLFFTKDYWDAFFANLSFVTFARADIAKALAEPYQRGLMNLESILAVTFATFFLLALRRKYKRKSF